MSDKYLVLELDYELAEDQMKDPKTEERIPNSQVTSNLINVAYQLNNPQMEAKIARLWRSITKKIEARIKAKKDYVLLSETDFQSIYDEVYKCKYSPSLAYHVPVLLDELDKVKNRKSEEAASLVKDAREAEEVEEKVEKVVEISKGKQAEQRREKEKEKEKEKALLEDAS